MLLAVLAAVAAAAGAPEARAGPGWVGLRPAPTLRTEVAVARAGRFAYVAGGFEQASGATTALVERYDLRANRWSRVADLPVALNHAAAAALGGHVYVAGG